MKPANGSANPAAFVNDATTPRNGLEEQVFKLLLIIPVLLTLASFFSRFGWWFDLTSHFQLQYLILHLVCVIIFSLQKRWRLVSVAAVFAFVNFLFIAPLYLASANKVERTTVAQQQLPILLINLNSSNREFNATLDYIKEKNPDILALEELNERWLTALADVLKLYPNREVVPRGDNFGIGLFSKVPPRKMEIKYFGAVQVPSVLAHFDFQNEPMSLLFTHPVPPASQIYYEWRNEQLEAIASRRDMFAESLILVGDLNTTSWSYHFKNFIKRMRLVDARKGFGLQVTWPTMLPILSISIDHILVSPDITVLNHEVGPDIGSDHYPVYIEITR